MKQLLNQLTDEEKYQKENNTFIFEFPNSSISNHDGTMQFLSSYFFNGKEIYISKHNRFSFYPKHSHEFLELNYMLSGSCKQIVDGQIEQLQTGELLLLDKGSCHSIEPLGEHDILINILFRDQSLNLGWFAKSKKENSILFDFLLNSSFDENHLKKYVLFKNIQIPHIQQILDTIITEYYLNQDYSDQIISLYLPILFTELIRQSDRYISDEMKQLYENINPIIVECLSLIEQNYATTSLSQVANTLGYNKNYLSNLVKKETGQTFTTLLNKKKLKEAHNMLCSTSLAVNEISQRVGFSNKTYFYNLFKKEYGHLPRSSKQNKIGNMEESHE